jgi:hypothetical protein
VEKRKKLGAQKLKVVCVKCSTLSLAVLVMSAIACHTQAHPCLELKIWPRFCPVSLSLSVHAKKCVLTKVPVAREERIFFAAKKYEIHFEK